MCEYPNDSSKPQLAMLAAVLSISLAIGATPATLAQQGQREDQGDLIVLHVYGSYRDMGRQQVELLGDEAARQKAQRSVAFDQAIAGQGLIARAFNAALLSPVLKFALLFEKSHFYDELDGVGDGLGISRTEAFRIYAGAIFGICRFNGIRRCSRCDCRSRRDHWSQRGCAR